MRCWKRCSSYVWFAVQPASKSYIASWLFNSLYNGGRGSKDVELGNCLLWGFLAGLIQPETVSNSVSHPPQRHSAQSYTYFTYETIQVDKDRHFARGWRGLQHGKSYSIINAQWFQMTKTRQKWFHLMWFHELFERSFRISVSGDCQRLIFKFFGQFCDFFNRISCAFCHFAQLCDDLWTHYLQL